MLDGNELWLLERMVIRLVRLCLSELDGSICLRMRMMMRMRMEWVELWMAIQRLLYTKQDGNKARCN